MSRNKCKSSSTKHLKKRAKTWSKIRARQTRMIHQMMSIIRLRSQITSKPLNKSMRKAITQTKASLKTRMNKTGKMFQIQRRKSPRIKSKLQLKR